MIKNDRQYSLSKAQIRLFESAIAEINAQRIPSGLDRKFPDVQRKALESQLQELNSEVQEYEALKAGKVTTFEANSLDDLPTLLVKARIARGITHKELANRLNVKEQQVQRWESNDFSGASIENLKAIADALGVAFTQKLFVPRSEVTSDKFLTLLNESGLSSDFILGRIVSPQLAATLKSGRAGLKEVVNAASTVATIFGLRVRDLVELRSPQFNFSVIATTRFKLPSRADKNAVTGYTLYAHYLAALLVQCAEYKPRRELPSTPHEFHEAVTESKRPITFESVIRFLWDCGIIVLPLADAGGFHGAVWKISGRFVMVLKQATPLESRWLYDALHESGHIRNGDVTDGCSLIEVQEISPEARGKEEKAANEWSENVLFDGRSEKLEEACTKACNGQLQKLKVALPRVAKEFNVNLGSLANHMAYRLAEQHENWWGAAHNLQNIDHNPFGIARAILLQNVNFARLCTFDRELIQRALSET
jgi:transcriptional regulator with XRE-family HTH domain